MSKDSHVNIIAFLNAYSQGKSGGDMCFIEIFKRIKNVNLTVITSKMGKQLCLENGLKASYKVASTESTFKHIIWTYMKRTIKAILITNDRKIDIIYATSDALPDVIPSLFLKMRNHQAKFIAKIFHIIPTNRFVSSISQRISHLLLKHFANIIIVDNTLLKSDLEGKGFNPSCVFINYPAIDSDKIEHVQPVPKFDATYLGRLHNSKGIEDLIRIWNGVVSKLPSAKLGIIGIGDETYTNKLSELILKNNLEKNIQLLGHLENKKAFGLIKGSNVFIFPSHEEGFGMVVGEALACEVPVVTYDLPVFQETFKKALITVPPFNVDKMKQNVLEVLQNQKNYDTLKATGKAVVSQFTWEKTANLELQIITS